MADRDPFAAADAPPARHVVPVDRRLVVLVVCLELGTVAMVTGLLIAKGGPAWVLGVVYASILASVLLIASMRTVVTLGEDRLRVSFRPIYWSSVRWDAITDAEPITAEPMRDAGGWGPKLRNGQTWLLARQGPAVRITRIGRRPLVVSAPDAEALAVAILERAVGGDQNA
ncbi:MAG: hypothetical protein ACF8QF_13060 [Phycisphaerales bacterium]